MDAFSKAAHLISPPKLPSDAETVEILINCMIQIHDIPSDLVSVWRAYAATWHSHIVWIEYADNSLTSFTSGFSPFMVSLGYQSDLFPT